MVRVSAMMGPDFGFCIQNVFIGGGSQGLGLAVAEKLAGYGAHVTIVSRSQSNLDIALAQVEVRL